MKSGLLRKTTVAWATAATHLDEGGHVRLLHGLDGGLHQRHGGLQLAAVAADEGADPLELQVLLLADVPHQLLLPLLQRRHQTLKMAAQLVLLMLPVLLRSEVRRSEVALAPQPHRGSPL